MNDQYNTSFAGLEPAQVIEKTGVGKGRWLVRIIKGIILAVVFLGPIFYLSPTRDILFGKVVFVEIAAIVSGALWLLSVTVTRRVEYARTPWNFPFLAAAIILVVATIASKAPWVSFWGGDLTGEKVASLIAFMVLAFVAAATFGEKDVQRAAVVLIASMVLLALFTVFSVLLGAMGVTLPSWFNINPVGTVNALAYVLTVGFLVSFGLAVSGRTSLGRRALSSSLTIFSLIAAVIIFCALIFIGFRMLWIGVAVVSALMAAGSFARARPSDDGKKEYALGSVSTAVILGVIIISAFLAWRAGSITARIFQPPIEISPSLSATLDIGKKVIRQSPALGVGPANFLTAYNRYRDVSLNTTAFWTARFSHGSSFLATILATGGILGLLVFLFLAASVLGGVWRASVSAAEPNPYLFGFGGGATFVVLMWFLYAGNFTASLLLFLSLGLVGASVRQRSADGGVMREDLAGRRGLRARMADWLGIETRTFEMAAPSLSFAVSLVSVFAAAFSLVALYGLVTAFAADVYAKRALRAVADFGNLDTAKVFLMRAASLNRTEDAYPELTAQASLARIQQIIAQASANSKQDLSGEFRSALSDGIGAAQRAAVLSPNNPQHWFTLGQLYEATMQFVSGADRAALEAYQKSHDADPQNPVIYLIRGRVHLGVADLMQLQINQTRSGDERSRLERAKEDSLREARQAFQDAIDLKADYADANFLLAQTYIRLGNVQDAIKKVEDTARLAPQDIGVHFQLGFLYYRDSRFDDAKREFQSAIALNDNYSNARYFLGLIFDREGDTDGALSQFVKIAALNPDNAEVKKIVKNLQAGRKALSGIVPPEPAPEKRKEVPVREKGQEPRQLKSR